MWIKAGSLGAGRHTLTLTGVMTDTKVSKLGQTDRKKTTVLHGRVDHPTHSTSGCRDNPQGATQVCQLPLKVFHVGMVYHVGMYFLFLRSGFTKHISSKSKRTNSR